MQYSLDTYNNFLERLISAEQTFTDRLLLIPANNMVADIDTRITMLGEDSNGEKIGEYSKRPSYATEEDFTNKSNFKPGKKKNGQTRKSVDLEEGYFELRALDGQRNDRVVLERTGAAIKNIKVGIEGNTAEIGFTDKTESDKIRWYEERNDKSVLAPTRIEIDQVAKYQAEEYRAIIKEIL